MIRKRTLALISFVFIVSSTSMFLLRSHYVNTNEVKVIAYKESQTINNETDKDSYQINKCENINAVEWISKDEVLTLSKKYDPQYNVQYCSVYNIDTKSYKDYNDVNIADQSFYGVSKGGKYVLYGENIYVPEDCEGEEWQRLYASGDLQHQTIKLLNLENNEISELTTQRNNSNAKYEWISDDKILIIYNNPESVWEILDVNGNVFAKGKFNYTSVENSGSFIVGCDDLEDLGDTVQGKFFFTKYFTKQNRSLANKIYSMDVSTLKEEEVKNLECSCDAEKKGNLVLTDFSNNNGEAVNGFYINRTFGFNISNINGSLLQTKELVRGNDFLDYSLSNDEKTVAYVESLNYSARSDLSMSPYEINKNTILKIMDIKTGQEEEIIKASDLKESELGEYTLMSITDLVWSKGGGSLMFKCKYSVKANDGNGAYDKTIKYNTYIVKFNK